MTSDLRRQVAGTIRRWRLIAPGDRVAAAVSGGSDSVALAWLLRNVAPDFGAVLAGLIHVNHQLRGAESDADEQFCRELAARLGVEIEVRRRDVAALARTSWVSVETAARMARYESFEEATRALRANVIATGHTADDQAETVVLRLLRGAGNRGLSGIRVRRGHIIRPLLESRRDDLRKFLRASGECWREDASNDDRSILRNRIRHELLPVLTDIGPGAVRALARVARLAADDESWLEEQANEKRATLVLSDREVDAAGLTQLPVALSRRIVRQIAAVTAPDAKLSADHLEAVCRLAGTDNPGGHLDLPGLTVSWQAGRLVFEKGHVRAGDFAPWPVRELNVPGVVTVEEAGFVITARHDRIETMPGDVHGPRVAMTTTALATPLRVRNRRPGDRLRPFGAPGHRKLQDVFVDRKVARSERDSVPIVTDAHGEILWVAGVALAERCRVRSSGDDMLILELRKLGTADT